MNVGKILKMKGGYKFIKKNDIQSLSVMNVKKFLGMKQFWKNTERQHMRILNSFVIILIMIKIVPLMTIVYIFMKSQVIANMETLVKEECACSSMKSLKI